MTLSIAAATPSGIILTADSRQTYFNKAGMTRVGTDNAIKLFQLRKKTGLVLAGRAFLLDQKGVFKNTGWFVEEFRKKYLKQNQLSTHQIAEELHKYFLDVYVNPEEARVKEIIQQNIKNEGSSNLEFSARDGLAIPYSFKNKDGAEVKNQWFIEAVNFIVAGYDSDGIGRAYLVLMPNGPSHERNTEFGGPLWIGQLDMIARIIKGFGVELNSLDFVKKAREAGIKVDDELGKLEFNINWGIMTLQDATDFCVLITRITESIQRFSDGTVMNPGGIPGVGGYINVAAITPDEGFRWINKREIEID